jgi:glycosyltransferase involved in cell wall biosynthesis
LEATNVCFKDFVPKDQIPAILSSADIILVPLKIQLTGAVPSKLYEAMAVGRPVILIAGCEAAAIVNQANCGVVVRPGDINNLVEAVRFLATNPEIRSQMGINGRAVVVERYNRKEIAKEFSLFLSSHV